VYVPPLQAERVLTARAVLFGGGGVMSYLTFGPEVKTVVLLNLPDSRTLQVVQFLYSAAILLSVPLQLFPAVRIMEGGLFPRSGKTDARVKWAKNAFRGAVVCVCAGVAWAGAADLDKFVALIGSFACVPLCYVYPPMLHLRACARTRRQKAADWALIVFGVAAAVYTTVQTLAVSRAFTCARAVRSADRRCSSFSSPPCQATGAWAGARARRFRERRAVGSRTISAYIYILHALVIYTSDLISVPDWFLEAMARRTGVSLGALQARLQLGRGRLRAEKAGGPG
jgi:hypothetical protein